MYLSACSPKQRRRFAACTCPHGVTKREVALRSQSVAEVPSVQPAKLASRRRRRSGHTPCGTGARFPTLSKLRKKGLPACSHKARSCVAKPVRCGGSLRAASEAGKSSKTTIWAYALRNWREVPDLEQTS